VREAALRSAYASAISGNSGGGEEPLSAEASTACASGGRSELRQRERRAQLETPRLLLLRDADCRARCMLGRRRIPWIALAQNFAAHAMQESVAPVFSCLACEG
jgi:hypothetical protein